MRRLLAVPIVMLVLVGSIAAVAPTSALAQGQLPTPWLRLDPDCIPGGGVSSRIGVRGSGFEPGTRVELRVRLPQVAPNPLSITAVRLPPAQTRLVLSDVLATPRVDGLGTFEASVRIAQAPPSGSYDLVATTRGGGPRSTRQVVSPCPGATVTANTRCTAANAGEPPASIVVRGQGFAPGDDRISVWSPTPGARGLIDETVRAGADGSFRVEIPIRGLPPGSYEVRAVSPNDQNASTFFETPCPTIDLRVLPECGPAGSPPDRFVVRIEAAGYHPGRPLLAIWDGPRSHEVFGSKTDRVGASRLDIRPYQRIVGTYTIRVRTEGADGTLRQRSVRFVMPCAPLEADIESTTCGRPAIEGEAERRWRIRISGTGFAPGDVDIAFDADALVGVQRFALVADTAGAVNDVIEPVAGPIGEYRIVARQVSAAAGTLTRVAPVRTIIGTTTFRSPCNPRTPPAPVIDGVCGPIAPGADRAYDIDVQGDGFYIGGIVRIIFGRGRNSQLFRAAAQDGSYSRPIRPGGRDEGRYPVRVEQRDIAGNVIARSGRVFFTVPCPRDPSIAVRPEYGPTGYTALVEGADFRPDSTITLTWDSGIEAGRPFQVEVDSEGAFEAYLFILPNDFPGERTLSAGLPEDPDAFPDVIDTYIVTPGSGLPPGAHGDQIVSRR